MSTTNVHKVTSPKPGAKLIRRHYYIDIETGSTDEDKEEEKEEEEGEATTDNDVACIVSNNNPTSNTHSVPNPVYTIRNYVTTPNFAYQNGFEFRPGDSRTRGTPYYTTPSAIDSFGRFLPQKIIPGQYQEPNNTGYYPGDDSNKVGCLDQHTNMWAAGFPVAPARQAWNPRGKGEEEDDALTSSAASHARRSRSMSTAEHSCRQPCRTQSVRSGSRGQLNPYAITHIYHPRVNKIDVAPFLLGSPECRPKQRSGLEDEYEEFRMFESESYGRWNRSSRYSRSSMASSEVACLHGTGNFFRNSHSPNAGIGDLESVTAKSSRFYPSDNKIKSASGGSARTRPESRLKSEISRKEQQQNLPRERLVERPVPKKRSLKKYDEEPIVHNNGGRRSIIIPQIPIDQSGSISIEEQNPTCPGNTVEVELSESVGTSSLVSPVQQSSGNVPFEVVVERPVVVSPDNDTDFEPSITLPGRLSRKSFRLTSSEEEENEIQSAESISNSKPKSLNKSERKSERSSAHIISPTVYPRHNTSTDNSVKETDRQNNADGNTLLQTDKLGLDNIAPMTLPDDDLDNDLHPICSCHPTTTYNIVLPVVSQYDGVHLQISPSSCFIDMHQDFLRVPISVLPPINAGSDHLICHCADLTLNSAADLADHDRDKVFIGISSLHATTSSVAFETSADQLGNMVVQISITPNQKAVGCNQPEPQLVPMDKTMPKTMSNADSLSTEPVLFINTSIIVTPGLIHQPVLDKMVDLKYAIVIRERQINHEDNLTSTNDPSHKVLSTSNMEVSLSLTDPQDVLEVQNTKTTTVGSQPIHQEATKSADAPRPESEKCKSSKCLCDNSRGRSRVKRIKINVRALSAPATISARGVGGNLGSVKMQQKYQQNYDWSNRDQAQSRSTSVPASDAYNITSNGRLTPSSREDPLFYKYIASLTIHGQGSHSLVCSSMFQLDLDNCDQPVEVKHPNWCIDGEGINTTLAS